MKRAHSPVVGNRLHAGGKAWLKAVLWVSLAGWIGLIFLFSSQSHQTQSIKPILERKLTVQQAGTLLPRMDFSFNKQAYDSQRYPYDVMEFIFRKAAHLFVYAVLAGLAWSLQRSYRIEPTLIFFNVIALTLLVACGDEFNQQYSTMRTPNPEDVLIDLIGGSLGVLILYLFSTLRRWSRSLSARIS